MSPSKTPSKSPSKPKPRLAASPSMPGGKEARGAVRFPVSLDGLVLLGEETIPAITRNVSGSGVLLKVDRELHVGLEIRFSVRMPGDILGEPGDAWVDCRGRVSRCVIDGTGYLVAAVIDDYAFRDGKDRFASNESAAIVG